MGSKMTRIVLLCLIAVLTYTTRAYSIDQTHSTLPQQNSSFITDLSLFLQREDAQRYIEQFTGMVVSGGTDVTGGTLSHTPTSLTAYPGGYYITETSIRISSAPSIHSLAVLSPPFKSRPTCNKRFSTDGEIPYLS